MNRALKFLPLMVVFLSTATTFLGDKADDYIDRGLARKAKGDWGGAVADFTQAIKLKPDYALAYNYRGAAKGCVTAHPKGDCKAAITDFTKAITLKPDLAEAYFNRGNVQFYTADLDAAIADFTKAVALKPGFVEAQNGLDQASREKEAADAVETNAFITRAAELAPHIRELIAGLIDPHPEVFYKARKELLHLGAAPLGALSVEPLINALNDPVPRIRLMAALSLGEIRDLRAIEPLIATLHDSDAEVRRRAAQALREIDAGDELANSGDKRAVDALAAALKNLGPPVADGVAVRTSGKYQKQSCPSGSVACVPELDADLISAEKIALLPVVDLRKIDEIRTENSDYESIQEAVANILLRNHYAVIKTGNSDAVPNILEDELTAAKPEWVKQLGPPDARLVMAVGISDIRMIPVERPIAAGAGLPVAPGGPILSTAAVGFLFEKETGAILWQGKGIGQRVLTMWGPFTGSLAGDLYYGFSALRVQSAINASVTDALGNLLFGSYGLPKEHK